MDVLGSTASIDTVSHCPKEESSWGSKSLSVCEWGLGQEGIWGWGGGGGEQHSFTQIPADASSPYVTCQAHPWVGTGQGLAQSKNHTQQAILMQWPCFGGQTKPIYGCSKTLPAREGPGSAQVSHAVPRSGVSVSGMGNQEAGERGRGTAAWVRSCPSLGPHSNRLGHLQPTLLCWFWLG